MLSNKEAFLKNGSNFCTIAIFSLFLRTLSNGQQASRFQELCKFENNWSSKTVRKLS